MNRHSGVFRNLQPGAAPAACQGVYTGEGDVCRAARCHRESAGVFCIRLDDYVLQFHVDGHAVRHRNHGFPIRGVYAVQRSRPFAGNLVVTVGVQRDLSVAGFGNRTAVCWGNRQAVIPLIGVQICPAQQHLDRRERVAGVAVGERRRKGVHPGQRPVIPAVLFVFLAAPAGDVQCFRVFRSFHFPADLFGQHGYHRVKIRLIVHAHAGKGQFVIRIV